MDNQRASIIIPVYNLEDYIASCVRSVLLQSYENLEIILVNDGSTDQSGRICDDLAKKDRRVKVIHKTNGGVSAARNAGLEAATGSYVMFVDGDDVIAPDMVKTLVADLEAQPKAVLARCGFRRIDSRNCALDVPFGQPSMIETEKMLRGLLTGAFENVGVCGGIFQKRVIGELRFVEGKRHNEDKYFLFEFLSKNAGRAVTSRPDKFYGYLVRPGSATKSGFTEANLDTLYFSDRILEETAKTYPEMIPDAEYHDIVRHLEILKGIVRSKAYGREKHTFRRIKNELLERYGGRLAAASRNYRREIIALKLGDWAYRGCVRLYELQKKLTR